VRHAHACGGPNQRNLTRRFALATGQRAGAAADLAIERFGHTKRGAAGCILKILNSTPACHNLPVECSKLGTEKSNGTDHVAPKFNKFLDHGELSNAEESIIAP
jgi:hypothetical protein